MHESMLRLNVCVARLCVEEKCSSCVSIIMLQHGERINVLFVQGVAAYYHRNHISNYQEEFSIQQNKLLPSVSVIEVKLQGCFEHQEYLGNISQVLCSE